MNQHILYPSALEEKIGFNRIKELLKSHCDGELGRSNVDAMHFHTDHKKVMLMVRQVDEFLKIIQSRESFPGGTYFNIQKYLIKASKIDAYLLEEELHELKLSLIRTEDILKFFKKHKEKYPELALLTVGIYLNPQLTYAIGQVIDERGQIRNSASDLLLQIRNDLQKLEFKVRNKLENILKHLMREGYSNDDATITIRNGRLVIPVRSEFKRTVSGFIHDESATGLTTFIEPSQVVEINNDIRDLTYQERREIIRILTEITDIIRPEITNLKNCNEFLGQIDFIRAKARLAVDLNGVLPEVLNKPFMEWQQARHPLLYLSHNKSGKAVIPLDISLSGGVRILVISGPNAGGKSVCLQTVGLLQYMLQCGLLVPLSEGSRMGIFQQLFIDIGDEQSLENDLSTYSSHLINMKYFVRHATPKTLFLIDEFGTGTEPQFGGAIAEAILDDLRGQKVFGVITTHYTNLKKYAEHHEGVINGAMRFDIKNMEPLFLLDTGKPGSSFALEIARKIGLPDRIIALAKQHVGATHVKFERIITELEEERRSFEQQKKEIGKKDQQLKQLVEDYESMKDYISSRKETMIREAREEADRLIQQANREIEKTIREIKEKKAEKEHTRKVRKSLEAYQASVKQEKPEEKTASVPQKEKRPEGPIRQNDHVKIRDTGAYGLVTAIRGNQAELNIGDLKSKVKLSRLEKVSRSEYMASLGGRETIPSTRKGIDLAGKIRDFSTSIDLRGKRAEEALQLLEGYLDDAHLLEAGEVRILHGKGDGILRNVIRNFLSRVDFVKTVRDEHVERGGAGVTVVTLK